MNRHIQVYTLTGFCAKNPLGKFMFPKIFHGPGLGEFGRSGGQKMGVESVKYLAIQPQETVWKNGKFSGKFTFSL